jgi:phosphate transport system permease protein
MKEINSIEKTPSLFQHETLSRYQRWRLIKDSVAGKGVIIGGLGVIAAIVLIFFYLLYVVFPLFESAESEFVSQYDVSGITSGKTLLLAMEEQNEIAVRFTDQGKAIFFFVATGKTILVETLAIPEGMEITSFIQGSPATGVVAYGLSDGRVIVAKHDYKVTYPNDVRLISPVIEYPLGVEPLVLDRQGNTLEKIAVRVDEDMTTLAAKTAGNKVILSSYAKEESLFDDEASLEQSGSILESIAMDVEHILIDKEQRLLYLSGNDGHMSVYSIVNKDNPELLQHLNVVEKGRHITSIKFLNGEISLLIADNSGLLTQWTMIRNDKNQQVMQSLRSFKVSDTAILAINAEQRRKGFMTADAKGNVGIYHSTAERELIKEPVSQSVPVALTQSPRANAFLLQDKDDKISFWTVHNEHPDISFASIWQEVWYESYPKPDYIWQSSSASNDFEPKMSLTPLVFGTLKAAFYAMMVAIPLAIMGAIYTAYFMAPAMRSYVKPSIELMEALPTVILGFLAGLWLAPFVEGHLVGIFSLFMIVPLGVMIFAFSWQHLPQSIRHKIPTGWDAALLIPVILLSAWFAFAVSPTMETIFFNGDMRIWMNSEFGIGYDQRNSIVVGLAMGFAVIPTIFSITEDAIFSVPKNLTIGSLALGATPWQTMTRVVLLTASPGIFSAVMIGFGRAVGETMIVLMATGNTPVMDLSVFQGMRTLSANIAVEMPESEVDSTHYRVLFLAALVLFMFTFVFNTLAELIRQNLREKYSSL